MKKRIIRLTKNEEMGYSAQVALIIGFVLSLSMGFLDVTIGILSVSEFPPFSFILVSLVTTISVFLLIYVILWFLVIAHLGRFFKVEAIPLALSLALFLGTIFTLASLNNLIHFSLSWADLYKLFILFSISLLVSIQTYFASKAVAQSNYKNTVVVFSFVTPFVLAETMGVVWLHIYRRESFSSMQPFLLNIGYILTVLFTLGLFYRIGQIPKLVRLLIAFIILIVLSPLVMLITAAQAPKYSLKEYKNKDHQIKHVILITVDTLRADVLSCYGNQNVSTPHIDQLTRDGILFTKAISAAPWTLPSVASIMTGLSPSVHMATRYNPKLPDILPTLAEYMRDAGYYTAAIGYNGFLTHSNISQGFLEYNFFPKEMMGSSLDDSPVDNPVGARLLQRLFPDQFRSEATTLDLTRLAINWLESNYKEDFFLWIHYFSPHLPYDSPARLARFLKIQPSPADTRFLQEFSQTRVRSGELVPSLDQRKELKALYEGEVRYDDENIGELLNTLKRLNLYNESLIIFTSDHGEEFWEHGAFEHGHSLYNELLWVPLIIKLPLATSKGQINKVVSTRSIMPTILDLCGINYEHGYLSVGSLSPLWGPNPDVFEEQPIISTGLLFYEDRESVIFDGLKYIRSLLTNREELYDLARDPKEQISIVLSSPDKVQRARNILREDNEKAKKLKEGYGIVNREEIKFDKETIQQMKSLGYVQ